MKTSEERNVLKEQAEAVLERGVELTDEKLQQVFGGAADLFTSACPNCGQACKWLGKGNNRDFWSCSNCGDMTFIGDVARWLKGIVR